MRHKAQIHMLSTEDKTGINLYLQSLYVEAVHHDNDIPFGTQLIPMPSEVSVPQHLYITVSQEVELIKEGDWMTDGREIYYNKIQLDAYIGFRKIIATTDKKIYQYKIHNEGRVKVDLPQIPQQFIKEYCDKGGIDTVMVGYEEILRCYKCNKLEEDCIDTSPNCLGYFEGIDKPKLNPDNTIIIHPLEEKMYSRQDMQDAWTNGFESSEEGKMHNVAKINWAEKYL